MLSRSISSASTSISYATNYWASPSRPHIRINRPHNTNRKGARHVNNARAEGADRPRVDPGCSDYPGLHGGQCLLRAQGRADLLDVDSRCSHFDGHTAEVP